MRFVGVDLHKQTITLAVVSAARKLLGRRRFTNQQIAQIVEFLSALGDFEITVEATASYECFVQLVEPLARRVVLAHPGKLRIIAERTALSWTSSRRNGSITWSNTATSCSGCGILPPRGRRRSKRIVGDCGRFPAWEK